MDPTNIIEWGGFVIILILIFAESGLLLGLIIPGGETLLFTAGLLTGTGTLHVPFMILLGCLIIAAVAGDLCGYLIGKKYGKKLYEKKDKWYFKKKYLHMTEDFYKKHQKSSLIVGKFLPIIRPFNPVISGTTGIRLPVFISFSAFASILYITAFVTAGYFLGNEFPIIKKYLGWIIPISIAVALIPFVIQIRKFKKEKQ